MYTLTPHFRWGIHFFIQNIDCGYSPGAAKLILPRFSEDFYCEMPKKFSKFHVPGTEMIIIADEKLISTVFRHVMFCVIQAMTS